jgi:SAM-dependent methyltransferase
MKVAMRASKDVLRFFLSPKLRWKTGKGFETRFWDYWLRTKGAQWPADYRNRLDPDFPVQPRVDALLPAERDIHILDVGAGPLTIVGKKARGKLLKITAVDPLADEYDKLLRKHAVEPIVRTQRLEAEMLTTRFSKNAFDFCYARNCLDHAYDPEQAVLQMIDVVKRARYVLLEHHPNEAKHAHYSGLHQWNFDLSPEGDFLIASRFSATNMTKKYADRCSISCELLNENGENWLVTRILKK